MYEYVLFNFAGFTSFPNSYELATQYKMATEVNQNFFAWSQEETSVQDISQVNESFFFFCQVLCPANEIYLKWYKLLELRLQLLLGMCLFEEP